jgi:hypothetical protein
VLADARTKTQTAAQPRHFTPLKFRKSVACSALPDFANPVPAKFCKSGARASLRPFYVSRSRAQHTIKRMEKIVLICLLVAAIALLAWWAKTSKT